MDYSMLESDIKSLKSTPQLEGCLFGISRIQRFLGIGYNRAERLVDAAVSRGVLCRDQERVHLVRLVKDSERPTLHLTLKKEWFDLIRSGVKTEEYREMKPYWDRRLISGKYFATITFRNGYGKDAPSFVIELIEIQSGLGVVEWGAPEGKPVYILKLGSIIG
ncbi:hypothetical protein [Enterovibrio paralichthyis]|uniref:hypothetical protein n=1 Tax=Enterovibrio paralichthyis TaxID=2853805 RepID=UPI001C44F4AD|nr:hypothetical protein [Enterovibrio paralichthyis]MBV7300232.1 hypothetical protein [Enterovibrio paralichthyis]